MPGHHHCQQEGCHCHRRTAQEDRLRGNQPDQPECRRDADGSYMVDRKGDTGRRRDVGRVGDLLEIGLHGNRQREECVVDHVEARCKEGILDKGVGNKHRDQTDIFRAKCIAFAEAADQGADPWRESHVEKASPPAALRSRTFRPS